MENIQQWPKKETTWIQDRTLFVSIPFTWLLPEVKTMLMNKDLFWDRAIVGGPAIKLLPGYLENIPDVAVNTGNCPGALQKVNPNACKTSIGCPNKCTFCAVPKIEPIYKPVSFKPKPLVCDNNLLALGEEYFAYVCHKLSGLEYVDFNQGLDCTRVTQKIADTIAQILPKKTICRLALDSDGQRDQWLNAYRILREARIPKANIRTYVLIGFQGDIERDWQRCEFVDGHNHSSVLPQWFHELYTLRHNVVTRKQEAMGWDEEERKRIMAWYYKHRGNEI